MRFILLLFFCLIGGAVASPVLAISDLVKSATSPAVYYLDESGVRHTFPTAGVFHTWYANFSGIDVLPAKELSRYKLGANVRVRPGVNLVSFDTDENVYAVEPGGIIRPFAQSEIIAKIYGDDWHRRLVVLPDAFFGDYTAGEAITYDQDLPSGALYYQSENKKYYYNDHGLLWPLGARALAENYFISASAITGNFSLDKRTREITGFNRRLFNPAATPDVSSADCQHQNFHVAFVLVGQDQVSQEEIDKINLIKDKLPGSFSDASRGLATMDASYPVVVLAKDKTLLFQDADGQWKPSNETINTFYDKNPDQFDFIILYNNYVAGEPETAKYLTLTNDFAGTGNAQMHSAYLFGSRGKLKGIANMGNLSKYAIDTDDGMATSENLIIHELLHHFSGRAIFLDSQGQADYSLLRSTNHDHWSYALDSASPLGGSGWRDNGDGTFTNNLFLTVSPSRQMSYLDLYFMGLVPQSLVPPIRYLVPDKTGDTGNEVKGKMSQTTIDRIVATMGPWSCRLAR